MFCKIARPDYNARMKKYRPDIFLIIAKPILDIIGVFSAFWISYYLRSVTDGIPFVQLRIPYISEAQFAPFVFAGIAIWLIIFTRAKLYSHIKRPIFEEIRRVMTYGFFWFFVFIGFVYLTQGFLFFKEIPRLMIFYTLFLATTFSVTFRSILHFLTQKLYQKNFFEKEKILIIQSRKNEEIIFNIEKNDAEYTFIDISETKKIENLVRKGDIDAMLLTSGEFGDPNLENVISLAKIYGVKCAHPRVMPHMKHFSREESFLAGIPVVTLSTVSITP